VYIKSNESSYSLTILTGDINMANNNRIFYACQSVELNGPSGTASITNDDYDVVQGLQSVGMTTNFNLEPVYQLGQLELYDNYEEIPEVEVSLNKVLDSRMTIYAMAMGTGALVDLANNRCGVRLKLFSDNDSNNAGTPVAQVECLPAYLSSVTYSFPTEGNFTEEVTLVSNDKVWASSLSATAAENQLTGSKAEVTGLGIARRGLIKTLTLPTGNNETVTGALKGGIPSGMKVQSMNISMNLGRESIFKLGQRTPYYRYVNFPVEVTCEIETVAGDGDLVGVAGSTDTACANPKALTNKRISIELCDGMKIDLGDKCKLTSVNYAGGDTGGGNATVTYSYQTFNTFTYSPPTGTWNTYSEYAEDDQTFPIT
jgi:hypothetical protein